MERSIEELVKRVAEGDDQAFTDLYSMTSSRAFYLAKRLLGDDDQAEDVLQEAYVKALTNLDQLKDPSRFQGWLDTIVANTSKNYLRKQQPQLFSQMGPDDDSEGIQDIEDESEQFSPEANVDYSETKRLVQEMIDHLPEDQRMAVLLHYMEDCSVKQIAGIMDCSEGTVKSRLNYGRKQIKQEVEALEKKGVKLYCAPLIPFLFWMFRQDVYAATTAGAAAVAGAGVVGATVATGAGTVGSTVAIGAETVGSTVATGSGTVGATAAAGTAAAGAGAVGAAVASGAGTVGATVTTGAGTVGATVTTGAEAVGVTVASGTGTVGATVTAGTAAASGATMAAGAGTVGATVTAGTAAASGATMAAGAGTIGATVAAGTAAAGAASERSANTTASYMQGASQGTPYDQNVPYDQSVPYNQGTQYNQNAQYNQGAPYNQNAPYNQGIPYDQNVPYNQGTANNQNVPYNQSMPYNQSVPRNMAGSVAAGAAGSAAGSAAAGVAGNAAGAFAAGAVGAAAGLAGKAAGGAVKAAGGAAKAAGRGAASIVRDVIIVLIVISVLGFGVYKGYEAFRPDPGPEATVEKLEKALNEMDLDGIIECFDPAIQSVLKGSISMFSMFSTLIGVDADISSALPGLLEFASIANGTLWPTFELETLDVTYTNDDKTMASVTVSIGGYDITGKVYDPEIEVWTMKKIDRTWYIELD